MHTLLQSLLDHHIILVLGQPPRYPAIRVKVLRVLVCVQVQHCRYLLQPSEFLSSASKRRLR
jgi:hypothetical protein